MAPDPHQPLRDDVRLLGELLGDTVRVHAGEAVFRAVERVRALSKSARAGNDADFRVLSQELSSLSLHDARLIARAFAQFLHLANIAEQYHPCGAGAPIRGIPRRVRSADRARRRSRACSPTGSRRRGCSTRCAHCGSSWF